MKLSKLKHMNDAAKDRRRAAIKRLEKQLKDGDKPNKKNGRTKTPRIPLVDSDIKRINKEIEILKTRI